MQTLIPETKKLEGINYNNMKHLLTTVISYIECTEKWEFVQYIQGNPSLFIVREKALIEQNISKPNSISRMNAYDPVTATCNDDKVYRSGEKNKLTPAKKPLVAQPKESSNSESEKLVEESEKTTTELSSPDSKLFKDVKMPW
jgi:hypothetical protein